MLAFLRDYIIYLWNVLFKQTRPVSGALVSTENNNASDSGTVSTSSASTTLPVPSTNKKDRLEEPAPELPKVPPVTEDKKEKTKPEPPKVITPTKPQSSNTDSTTPQPIQPVDLPKSSIDSTGPKPTKPADLSYPSAPLAQPEKPIPPEPSRPPPSLSETKTLSKTVPQLEATKSVSPLSEVKATPTLPESKPVPSQTKPLPQESPLPVKPISPPLSPFVSSNSIPSKESEKVETKVVSPQPVAVSPRTAEVPLKPKIVEAVKREVTPVYKSEDFEDEEDYDFEEEEVEEDEDIEDYSDRSAEKVKLQTQPTSQPQQLRTALNVEEYDSEDDIIPDIDDEIRESETVVKSK